MNLDKNIGWCTHTHNIMTGCLNKNLGICNVNACYAQKTAENPYYRKAFPYGFEPHFYPERLNEVQKLRKPAIIFMDSMSDLFGSWWGDEEIEKVLHVMDCMRGVHWHKYVVLTKNPVRMAFALKDYMNSEGAERLKNVYFGVSVTGEDCLIERDRLVFLRKIKSIGYKTVISFEPLLHNPLNLIKHAEGIGWADWVILGGQTKPQIYPPYMSKCVIRDEVDPYDKPLFIKDNAKAEGCKRNKQDRCRFPSDLLPIAVSWGKV